MNFTYLFRHYNLFQACLLSSDVNVKLMLKMNLNLKDIYPYTAAPEVPSRQGMICFFLEIFLLDLVSHERTSFVRCCEKVMGWGQILLQDSGWRKSFLFQSIDSILIRGLNYFNNRRLVSSCKWRYQNCYQRVLNT